MLAILHMAGLEKSEFMSDQDGKELWKRIYDLMDGERCYIKNAEGAAGKYLFLGLESESKNKELYWLIEQDDVIGCGYSKDEFEAMFESGEYEGPDGCMYLEPENVEVIF